MTKELVPMRDSLPRGDLRGLLANEDRNLSAEVETIDASPIWQMIEQSYLSPGEILSFASRRQIIGKLSPTTFRKHGLLGLLTLEFGGDIPLSVHAAYPSVQKKQLLGINDYEVTSPLQEWWQERADVIEEEIGERTHRLKREPLIGRGGEVFKKQKRRGRPKPIFMTTNSRVKRPEIDIQQEEIHDESVILNKIVHDGDTVIQLYGDATITTAASILDKVGPHGTVYYHANSSQIAERLYEDFFKATVYQMSILGEKPHLGVRSKLSERFASEMSAHLQAPFYDSALYEMGFNSEVMSELVDRFYQQYPLIPITDHVLPFLQSFASNSVDVLIEEDRFSQIPEEEKEAVLWEVDRVLKQGGKIAFREDGRGQAGIEYYGQEIFSSEYYNVARPNGIKHPRRWITLRKSATPLALEPPETFPEQHVSVEQKVFHKKSDLEGLTAVLASALQAGECRETLSISWFKNKGQLRALITEFGGNIDKAIASIPSRRTQQSNVPPITVPKDAQSSYTIADIALQLGISQSEVKNALSKRGIKQQKVRGFSSKSQQLKQQNFSYLELQVIKGIVREPGLLKRENREKEGEK